MRLRVLAAVLAAVLFGSFAWAQTPPTRVRGTIESATPQMLIVKSRDGQKLEINLNENLTVAAVKTVDLASIGPGNYVGIATRTGTGGILVALEVLLFPEAMRGAGEGHYAWDLEPGSMMTNGTVNGAVAATNGRELKIAFKGDNNTIVVPPDVPVVTFTPADRSDLKPGARVFLSATKNAQGQLAAGRVTVEKDGVAPPM